MNGSKRKISCFWGFDRKWPIERLRQHFISGGYEWFDCGAWKKWNDLDGIIKQIRSSSHVFVWNGGEAAPAMICRLCDQMERPFTIIEHGWFPQADTFHFDPKGIVGRSSLCGSLDWVTEVIIEDYRSFREEFMSSQGIRWFGDSGGPVLVPLQVEYDTAIYLDAPRGMKTMAALVRFACERFPNREIIVCKHPVHRDGWALDAGRWRYAEEPTVKALAKACLVVGITSTFLLISSMAGCPTVALGNCPLRHHKLDEERLLAAYYARQIPRTAEDLSPWLNQVVNGPECGR